MTHITIDTEKVAEIMDKQFKHFMWKLDEVKIFQRNVSKALGEYFEKEAHHKDLWCDSCKEIDNMIKGDYIYCKICGDQLDDLDNPYRKEPFLENCGCE